MCITRSSHDIKTTPGHNNNVSNFTESNLKREKQSWTWYLTLFLALRLLSSLWYCCCLWTASHHFILRQSQPLCHIRVGCGSDSYMNNADWIRGKNAAVPQSTALGRHTHSAAHKMAAAVGAEANAELACLSHLTGLEYEITTYTCVVWLSRRVEDV